MIGPLLAAVIIFGVWISYSDVKNRKIKNYSLLLLIFAALFINTQFNRIFIERPLDSSLNVLGAIVIGVMIWLAGIWSAADAKLFIALNVLFPINFYSHYSGYFPGFAILVNSAIPLFVYLFLQILFKTSLKDKKEAFLVHLKPQILARFLLVSAAMFCLTTVITYFLKIRLEYILWVILLFSLFWLIEQKLKTNLTYFFVFAILFSSLLAILFNLTLFDISSLMFIFGIFFLIFILFVLSSLGISLFAKSVEIDNIKEGMILAEAIAEEEGKYVKKPITFFSFFVLLRERSRLKLAFGFNPDGLEKEEAEKIRSLAQNGLLDFDEIKVSFVMPLAPVLFLGALITYFLRGSLVS